ncbi:hypothetical protein D7U36_09815 [Propionibacterium australiense]|uniref:Uncharacterized protein n=1 Tax=Propionibacterium australiense TaxID=119981 RepID=A0A8B3GDZ0_9ACTN|nr:hypothetical protein D7U36_09815 [Propionibacterium australiense]
MRVPKWHAFSGNQGGWGSLASRPPPPRPGSVGLTHEHSAVRRRGAPAARTRRGAVRRGGGHAQRARGGRRRRRAGPGAAR